MVDADPGSLETKANRLKKRLPVYAEIVDWLVDLLSEVRGAKDRVCLPPDAWDRSLLSQRIQSKKPLFKASVTFRSTCRAQGTFTPFWRTGRSVNKENGPVSGACFRGPTMRRDSSSTRCLPVRPENLESVCTRHGADPAPATLLMRLALLPSLRQVSRRAEQEFDLAGWSSGRCPVCGSRPNLATLGEKDKSRTLYCSVCETSWNFPRLKCPFCGNDQSEGLSYMYAEEEKGLRMDLCERCGQGIGTIDTKYDAGPVIPVLDQLAISHLATAAAKSRNRDVLS